MDFPTEEVFLSNKGRNCKQCCYNTMIQLKNLHNRSFNWFDDSHNQDCFGCAKTFPLWNHEFFLCVKLSIVRKSNKFSTVNAMTSSIKALLCSVVLAKDFLVKNTKDNVIRDPGRNLSPKTLNTAQVVDIFCYSSANISISIALTSSIRVSANSNLLVEEGSIQFFTDFLPWVRVLFGAKKTKICKKNC